MTAKLSELRAKYTGQLAVLPDVPPPAAVPVDPVQALKAQHCAQGLHLHARTALPNWLGERLDLGWAIDVLHPLARPGGGAAASRGRS